MPGTPRHQPPASWEVAESLSGTWGNLVSGHANTPLIPLPSSAEANGVRISAVGWVTLSESPFAHQQDWDLESSPQGWCAGP